MPGSVASDLGLHCLPMSLLWEVRFKWVNVSDSIVILCKFCKLLYVYSLYGNAQTNVQQNYVIQCYLGMLEEQNGTHNVKFSMPFLLLHLVRTV